MNQLDLIHFDNDSWVIKFEVSVNIFACKRIALE